MFRKLGIRLRVMLVATIPSLALAVFMTTVFTSSRLSDLEQAHSDRGRAIARQLAAASEYAVFAGDRGSLRRLASSALAEVDVRGILVTDREGNILARVGDILPMVPPAGSRLVVGSNPVLQVVEPVVSSQLDIDDPFSEVPASGESGTRVIGSVTVSLTQENFMSRRAELIWASIGTLILVLAGSVIIAERMSRGVTAPIRKIAEMVTRIGDGKLSERIHVDGGGSLKALADGVNEMAVRLEASHEEMTRKISEATAALLAGKEEAERANLSKSRFLAAASHDLRQPMHALGLFIAELQEQSHAPHTRRLVRQIAASAEAMENLLDSLLDISRLDAGVLHPNLQGFALQPLLDRLVAGYRPAAEERGLRLKCHPTQHWVHTDPLLLERILGNLVSNAIRYTRSGTILVGCRRAGEQLRLEVRDSGIGIAPDAQEIIFQEFVQLDNPERARNKGLGLGLAIVRRLTDLLKLELTLRSEVDRGSVFAITIPRATPVRPQLRPESERNAGDLAGVCVAVVDDDPLALSSLVSLLSAWHCVVVAGEDLQGLLQSLDEEGVTPELLISDYRLQDSQNGVEVVLGLRQLLRRELPAILISGDTGAESLQHAQRAGLVLLHKPVRPARLRALIHRLLNEQQA